MATKLEAGNDRDAITACFAADYSTPSFLSKKRRKVQLVSCHSDFCEAKIEQWKNRAGEQ
jgi:hypothetical protein